MLLAVLSSIWVRRVDVGTCLLDIQEKRNGHMEDGLYRPYFRGIGMVGSLFFVVKEAVEVVEQEGKD